VLLGEKMKALREARGVSQEQMADMLDVSVPTISRWESGSRGLRTDVLERYALILKVDMVTFFAPELWSTVDQAKALYDAALAEVRRILSGPDDHQMLPNSRNKPVLSAA
jgi:transcriptional regulator with XRE-family HTH domain